MATPALISTREFYKLLGWSKYRGWSFLRNLNDKYDQQLLYKSSKQRWFVRVHILEKEIPEIFSMYSVPRAEFDNLKTRVEQLEKVVRNEN